MMDLDGFWRLIEKTQPGWSVRSLFLPPGEAAAMRCKQHAEALVKALARRSPEEIAAFGRILNERLNEAYREDLLAAAYLITGFVSADGFEYFRAWLIGQGRETFERTLRDPDSLAEIRAIGLDECSGEFLLPVADEAYEGVTGEELIETVDLLAPPDEPAGEPWRAEDLPKLLPRLSARFPDRKPPLRRSKGAHGPLPGNF